MWEDIRTLGVLFCLGIIVQLRLFPNCQLTFLLGLSRRLLFDSELLRVLLLNV